MIICEVVNKLDYFNNKQTGQPLIFRFFLYLTTSLFFRSEDFIFLLQIFFFLTEGVFFLK